MSNINVNTVTPDSGDKVSISGSLRISQSIYAPNIPIDNTVKHVGFNTSTGQVSYFTGSFGVGTKGQKGTTGTSGPSGNKGQKGQKGSFGPKGQKGSTGVKGANSTVAGNKGQKGQKGGTGVKGTTGTGPISISGTPVNNQVGIWTSATAMEGDPDITYDGTTLKVTGSIQNNAFLRNYGTSVLTDLYINGGVRDVPISKATAANYGLYTQSGSQFMHSGSAGTNERAKYDLYSGSLFVLQRGSSSGPGA